MVRYRNYLFICFLAFFTIKIITASGQPVKGQNMRMHKISGSPQNPAVPAARPSVCFLTLMPVDQSGPEILQAYNELKSFGEYETVFMTLHELEKKPATISKFSLIWIHRIDTAALSAAETHPVLLKSLKTFVENGGRLMLTLQAIHYLNVLGFESSMLQDSTKRCVDEGNGRKLGFHAFREHPVFRELNGGAYIYRPVTDITTRISGFFGTRLPREGKVVGVDWDYIFLRESSKIILEYSPGKGRVLAIGGYTLYGPENYNRAHLKLFTANCLRYLLDQSQRPPVHYWDYAPGEVKPCPEGPALDRPLAAVPPSVKWDAGSDGLTLKNRFASDNFWDVAGERLVTMGSENGGIEEVWAHPFMAFRDYEVGIMFEYKDSIYWLNDERPEIEVNPSFFSRLYKFPRAYLKELVVNDPVEPEGVIHYEYRGVYPAQLIIRFKSNLRLMWPYSEKTTGSICYSWDSDLDAFTAQDLSGTMSVRIGGTRKPALHLEGQYDGFRYLSKEKSFQGIPTEKVQAACLIRYDLGMNDNLDIVYAATNEGTAVTRERFGNGLYAPEKIFGEAGRHAHEILQKNLMLTTPDVNFNTGYRWALLATDRFFVNTPGMGKALVAGYATTRHGWDGEHKVNGRPGYSWYFGRDGEWSSFALLGYGDFEKVRSELEFFNRYQDLSGKILHEVSTSGIVHYDAADATPLYIVLAGKYFRHTNDTAFLRKTWPNVKKAIAFCYSTDTDHNHLIENTNVGHGWVEGGELYGSHETIYMAGSWAAALTEAANMADFMRDPDAIKYSWESDEVKKVINEEFWGDQQQFFSYGRNLDGKFRWEPTVLPAVPIYFKTTDPIKGSICLKQYAGNAFTTAWGVRILRDDSRLFKPTGYHYGSVWPLFTGWTSLAEYATGNYLQGYSHLMNNLNIYKCWGLGFAEEVLNGAEYKPSGVCSHQCWSETMVLQPVIEGMLGIEINARENKMTLAPRIPDNWDSLNVQNIRVDSRNLGFHFSRETKTGPGQGTNVNMAYDFSKSPGNPVKVEFIPSYAPGTVVKSVSLDGKQVAFTCFKTAQSVTLYATFELRSPARLLVETEPGITVLPAVSDPRPGDPAEGLRILSTRLSGNRYAVEVEGKGGTSGLLEIYSPGQPIFQAGNARFLEQHGPISRFAIDFEQSEKKYTVKTISINFISH
ncbi:MAG: GH116 family glycosyl hydrolase [Bacteroidota bacterium]